MDLPIPFQENMKKLLGEEYAQYEKSFGEPRLYGLRINRTKISRDEFEKINPFKTEPIPWIDNGFFYQGNIRPAKHPYYYAGLYYLQEPSAMTPANRIPIMPGDKVLDICAAPGGKSTELGAKLNGEGLLVTNDISNSRAQALLKNIELFGIGNVCVMSEAPYKMAPKFKDYFDKILIDAPCSGEGMFRKEPAVLKAWTEESNNNFSKLQREIIDYAVQMLKPGGMMLYSTCTFSPKENEESISYLLDQYPEFELCEMNGYEGFSEGMTEYGNHSEDLKKCVRIWPQRMNGEGHFVALLRKMDTGMGQASLPSYINPTKKKDVLGATEMWDFLKMIDRDFDPDRIEFHQDKVFYLPEGLPDLSRLRLMRTGLLLGEIKKNRFEPSQALAMNLKMKEFSNCLNLSVEDPDVLRYLKGETLNLNEDCGLKNGYALVCVDGFPLGFGKYQNGTMKNKYLPGWRWQ